MVRRRAANAKVEKAPAKVPSLPGLKVGASAVGGRYRIESLLGVGSSGYVVVARHVYLRRQVTLKILTAATSNRPHRVAANLHGRHVARVLDTGATDDGLPFVATERLAGRTLADELAERTQLPIRDAVRWILQACEGLAEAHAAGIVHGALKPQNLFLAEENRGGGGEDDDEDDDDHDGRVLKILDFGMRPPLEAEGSNGAAWFASPAYLAPEQLGEPDRVDARADIWALGVIAHELVAGSLPFSAETVAGMFVAVAHDEPSLLATAEASFDLARVVRSCISKDPSKRPANVAELARALAPFAGVDGARLGARIESVLEGTPAAALTTAMTEPTKPLIKQVAKRSEPSRTKKTDPSRSRSNAKKAPASSWGAKVGLLHRGARERGHQVGAAAALAVAGVLALASALTRPATPTAESPAVGSAQILSATPAEDVAPRAAVPASFNVVEERAGGRDAGVGPVYGPWSPARANGPGRGAGTQAGREDPAQKGFTHPARLGDRRQK